MTKVIDESGAPQTWTAVYWRFFNRHESEHDSFASAYRFLDRGEDSNELSSEAILGPDGQVLMDSAALSDAQCSDLDPDDLLLRLNAAKEIQS